MDVLSLVLGLFFIGSALIWGLSDDPGHVADSWPLPTLLIVVGVVGSGVQPASAGGATPDDDRPRLLDAAAHGPRSARGGWMTSQDDLALLKQMYQRGEITDEQYDVLRRHVLWGTPLPQLEDECPSPRSGRRPGRRVRSRGRHRRARTGRRPCTRETGAAVRWADRGRPARRRSATASRRERREAEEAAAHYPAPPAHHPARTTRRRPTSRGASRRGCPLPTTRRRPTGRRATHRRGGFQPPDYPPPAESTGPLPPVGGVAPPRRHRRREEAPAPEATGSPAPTERPSSRRHRRLEQAAPPDELATRRGRRAGRARTANRTAPVGATARRRQRAPEGRKRRPRRRSVVAVLTSVVLALALAAGGVYWFELRRQGLPPTAYARQACGTVRDWQQAVDSSNATLISQISREQNKTTIRSDVTAYYTTIAGRTDQLRVAILDLGPADAHRRPGVRGLARRRGRRPGAAGCAGWPARPTRLDPAAATFPTDLQGILTGADTAVSAVTAALARPAAGITTELRTTLSNEPACAPYVG